MDRLFVGKVFVGGGLWIAANLSKTFRRQNRDCRWRAALIDWMDENGVDWDCGVFGVWVRGERACAGSDG
jgi:hypothetical protein